VPRPIAEQVVVVTGASTGIGRATALALAKRGARVVLAARGDRLLGELQQQITSNGSEALMVPTDVADFVQVQQLAEDALARYGRIDTWINNAGVSLFASVRNTEVAEFRRLMDVNYMGQVHGAKVALPLMHRQGEGTIIFVGSVESKHGLALQAAYSASKAAIDAFAQALRQEVQGTGIAISTILPASIDTPLYQHARCKEGCEPRPLPPFYSPEKVARVIVGCCEQPRSSVVVGASGRMLVIANAIAPALAEKAVGGLATRWQSTDVPEPPFGHDNLDQPMEVTDPLYGGLRARWPYLSAGPVRALSAAILGVVMLPVARAFLGLLGIMSKR
jgi:short-subunit dehydrogenase